MVSLTMSIRAIDRRDHGIGGLARASTILLGGMVALQSSQDLDIVKIGYLAAAALAVVGSIWIVYQRRSDPLVDFARPWLITSIVVGAIVGGSLPVALLHGTAFASWVRDAAAYALLVAAPWVAVDVALSVSRRTMAALIVAAGGLATLSYAIVWVQRRAMADIPMDRLVLPSFMLATALFAFAVARSVSDRDRRYWWAVLASVTIALLLLAGTRTTLAILIVPIAVLGVAWRGDPGGLHVARLTPALLPLLTAGVIVASSQLPSGIDVGRVVASLTGSNGSGSSQDDPRSTPDPHSLEGRFDTFGSVLTGRDASLQDRVAQTLAAWDVFGASPIVGGGLGVVVPWTTTAGHRETQFTADTPLLVLAKFGLLGLVLVGALVGAWIITIQRLRPGGAVTQVSRLALVGFGAALLVLTPFGWQLEDKGTGLAFILLLGFAFREFRDVDPARRGRTT